MGKNIKYIYNLHVRLLWVSGFMLCDCVQSRFKNREPKTLQTLAGLDCQDRLGKKEDLESATASSKEVGSDHAQVPKPSF